MFHERQMLLWDFRSMGKWPLHFQTKVRTRTAELEQALENQVLNTPPAQPNSEDSWICSAAISQRIDNYQTEGSVPVNTPNSKVNSQICLRIFCLLLIRLLSHLGKLPKPNCQTMHNKACFTGICTNLDTAGTPTHGPVITGSMQNIKMWRTEWICLKSEYIKWISCLSSVWNSLC